MSQLEHIEAIEKRLWSAADTLRAYSNYAGNGCFLPVTEEIAAGIAICIEYK
jgi:type I restriction enzyme M protein